MTENTMEISTDYDHDSDDGFAPIDDGIGELDQELYQLLGAAQSLEAFGMNPTAFMIGQTTNLWAGTSLQALAVENFSYQGPNGVETEMALEALVDKIKDKMAMWSAKVLSFVRGVGDKITNILSGMWDALSTAGKDITAKAWDKAKVAGKTIKAHPYQTIAAVAAAAVAVAAIVAMVAAGQPGAFANESALQSFMYKMKDMITNIKWPFGKLTANVVEGTYSNVDMKSFRLSYVMEATDGAAKASDTIGKLGWGQAAARAVSGQLSRVWSILKAGIGGAGSKVLAGVKAINDIGGEMPAKVGEKIASKTKSKLAGWASSKIVEKMYMTALWSIVGVMYHLLKDIVLTAFKTVTDTFKSLKPATSEA